MGDPRKTRAKYQTPVHPWQKDRLETEKSLMKQYGLVNKTEVYKATSKLKKFKDIAKSLVKKSQKQAEIEQKQLFDKLKSLKLVDEENFDLVLGLKDEQLLERRLQTIVFKKGLARSVNQARQMITHRHIAIDGKKITSPSYLVSVEEESKVEFYANSSFSDENHPERKAPEKEVKEEVKSDNKKEDSKANPKETKEETSDKEAKEEVKSEVEEK